jgi:hypothetical protein
MVAMKKRKKLVILLLGLYIFLYILVKYVVFARREGEVYNFELGI